MLRWRYGFAFTALCLVLGGCGRSLEKTSSLDFSQVPECTSLTPASQPRHYYLATGSRAGTYVKLGTAIRDAVTAGKTGISLDVCATQGSSENLDLLKDRRVDFALVQMDTLHDVLLHPDE